MFFLVFLIREGPYGTLIEQVDETADPFNWQLTSNALHHMGPSWWVNPQFINVVCVPEEE